MQRAHELVTREAADGAYVFFPCPRRWAEALDLLHLSDHVIEAAPPLRRDGGRGGPPAGAPRVRRTQRPRPALRGGVRRRGPQVLRFKAESIWQRPGDGAEGDGAAGKEEEPAMRARVLIKVPAKQIGALIEELRNYRGIVEALIYGETDVIAKLEVPDQDALDELVVQRIQSIDAVESTRTFIAIEHALGPADGVGGVDQPASSCRNSPPLRAAPARPPVPCTML